MKFWSGISETIVHEFLYLIEYYTHIGFYGTNLNTSIVLGAINYTPTVASFTDTTAVYDYLWANTVGTLIIALCGNVPGYFFTAFFVDKWGRKPIQVMGFVMLIVCFTVLSAAYSFLKANALGAFVVIYAVAQFFFNFGPNSTTFIIPAECFPTHVRSTGHGISAASGKLGAIIAAQGFSLLVDVGGAKGSKAFMPYILVIFAALMFLGLCFTYFVPETKNVSLEEISARGNRSRAQNKNIL